MYKIFIKDLRFDAILGILEEERKNPQEIKINCKIKYERLKKEDFINYANVAKILENFLKEKKFFLVEDALDESIKRLKEEYPMILSIKISIFKPKILQNSIVGVTKSKKF